MTKLKRFGKENDNLFERPNGKYVLYNDYKELYQTSEDYLYTIKKMINCSLLSYGGYSLVELKVIVEGALEELEQLGV